MLSVKSNFAVVLNVKSSQSTSVVVRLVVWSCAWTWACLKIVSRTIKMKNSSLHSACPLITLACDTFWMKKRILHFDCLVLSMKHKIYILFSGSSQCWVSKNGEGVEDRRERREIWRGETDRQIFENYSGTNNHVIISDRLQSSLTGAGHRPSNGESAENWSSVWSTQVEKMLEQMNLFLCISSFECWKSSII